MFTSVSRREAIRRVTAALVVVFGTPARGEEWSEGAGPQRDEQSPETSQPQNKEAGSGPSRPQPAETPQTAPVCKVTAQSVEGPFYFDPKLVRTDITEAEQGSPLDIALSVIDAATCLPVANARVDVWHANASGHYSGFANQGDQSDISTEGKTFLRGTQVTSSDGTVQFLSIYPGWYKGRAPHVHVKVLLEEKLLVTAQIYFPEILTQRIYGEHEPYNARGGPETANAQDAIFAAAGGGDGQIIAGISAIGDTITASLTLAVDKTAAPVSGQKRGFWYYLHELIWK